LSGNFTQAINEASRIFTTTATPYLNVGMVAMAQMHSIENILDLKPSSDTGISKDQTSGSDNTSNHQEIVSGLAQTLNGDSPGEKPKDSIETASTSKSFELDNSKLDPNIDSQSTSVLTVPTSPTKVNAAESVSGDSSSSEGSTSSSSSSSNSSSSDNSGAVNEKNNEGKESGADEDENDEEEEEEE